MRSRLTVLTESLLRQRGDVTHLSPATDDPEDWLDFCGPDYFDELCIYDPVDDDTAQWLLSDWLDGQPNIGWSVHLEFSKLLTKRGQLVRDRVERIIRSLAREAEDSVSWLRHQLSLSFLCKMSDGEELAIQLLDLATSDSRDGLLLACYKMNTPAIYEAVKAAVRRWEQDIWCRGTGEHGLVDRIVQQWDQTFPQGDHADIRRMCEPI